jgi:high-affinity Fe2+/Pb2+ permease
MLVISYLAVIVLVAILLVLLDLPGIAIGLVCGAAVGLLIGFIVALIRGDI